MDQVPWMHLIPLFGRTFLLLHPISLPILEYSKDGKPSFTQWIPWVTTLWVDGVKEEGIWSRGIFRPEVVWKERENNASSNSIPDIHSLIHSLTDSLNATLVSMYFVPSAVFVTEDKDEQVHIVPALHVYGLCGGYQESNMGYRLLLLWRVYV